MEPLLKPSDRFLVRFTSEIGTKNCEGQILETRQIVNKAIQVNEAGFKTSQEAVNQHFRHNFDILPFQKISNDALNTQVLPSSLDSESKSQLYGFHRLLKLTLRVSGNPLTAPVWRRILSRLYRIGKTRIR